MKQHQSALSRLSGLVKKKKEKKQKNKKKILSTHLPLPTSKRHLMNSNPKQTLTLPSSPASPSPTPAQQKSPFFNTSLVLWASSQCLIGLTRITEAVKETVHFAEIAVAVLALGSAIIIAAYVHLLLLLLAIVVIAAVALLLAAREAARAHPAEEEAALLIVEPVPDSVLLLLLLANTVDLDIQKLERSC
jgi:hypothetical protein